MRGAGRGGVEVVRGGLARLRASRAAVVVLVYAALVLDNMLLTVLGKPLEIRRHLGHMKADRSPSKVLK